jgi:NADH:ubiquinone oxidoreductase subunit F (NADH-binding)/NADH:ubiquinone oxidoreductase subunit E/Pyruvate/2-oxoacid:ferredoxin oxidoreductase delta subunit
MNSEGVLESADTSWLDETITKIGRDEDTLIPLLQAIQTRFNYLPPNALLYLCKKTGISSAAISGVSTFYDKFRHTPAGKHTISVCVGTACHVKGADLIYDAFHRYLKCEEGCDTDPEGLFTLSKVSCLGCCTLAPVVQVDSVTYGHLTTSSVPEVIKDFLHKQNNKSPADTTIPVTGNTNDQEIRIGVGSCCVAGGSADIFTTAQETVSRYNLQVSVKPVGCIGMCHRAPLLEIRSGGISSFYSKVYPDDVTGIILKHFKPSHFTDKIKKWTTNQAERLLKWENADTTIRHYRLDTHEQPVQRYLDKQVHIASEYYGTLDPSDIEDYRNKNGFGALHKCLHEFKPSQIIDIITESGLRGRGGAGFPTGLKWKRVQESTGSKTYIICNGDEGDPGAFMDRMLLESYPYRVIEGMIIAAIAVDACEAIFYIRSEYPLALKRIRHAIEACREQGVIGQNILNSHFSIDFRVVEGAGAFVCGEETALLRSIEGKRGTPGFKPPYPSSKGLWGEPTLINNCETFACVPWIIRNGAHKFADIGTGNSHGTKVFSLAGKIRYGGLIEVPMGLTIQEIVEEIGGGIADDHQFKAVQIGGPSGGCIPASMSNIVVDYEELIKAGAMMGSGGMVVLDDRDCMVDIARYFLSFTQSQSCGRCTFCRIGTLKLLGILGKICSGKGCADDLIMLEDLSQSIKNASLCGLGKSAPNPVLTTLRYFKDEYEAHLKGICPAGKCKELIRYTIDTNCNGCTICSQKCPVKAIPFTPYQQHTIDDTLCIRCDLCKSCCPAGAVNIVAKNGTI